MNMAISKKRVFAYKLSKMLKSKRYKRITKASLYGAIIILIAKIMLLGIDFVIYRVLG